MPLRNCWPGFWISDTIATPVSDGQIVAVQFGHGQCAAYEIATGKRLWAFRDPGVRATSVSHAVSPLLWKDLVIFNAGLPGKKDPAPSLLAVERSTGKVRWENPAGTGGCGFGVSHGDHMPNYLARIQTASGVKAVVVSNKGAVVDAETGETLIEKLAAGEAETRWGAGYIAGLGNLVFKSVAGDSFSPPTESWEFNWPTDGKLQAVARPVIPLDLLKAAQSPFALSDRVLASTRVPNALLLDPHTRQELAKITAHEGTPTIAGNVLIIAKDLGTPNGNSRQDRLRLCAFTTIDISDPTKPRVLSKNSLLGTAAMPADIMDKYFPAIAKNPDLKALTLGGYHGVASGFGVYMAGVTAHGNRLFILSQSHLYCIAQQ